MNLEPPDRYLLHIQLFGTGSVEIRGEAMPPLKYRKEFWLFAFLVLRSDREVARDELTALFWPDNDEELAHYYLRRSLSHLRRALGSQAYRLLAPSSRTLRLDLEEAFCDVAEFDRATASSSDERLKEAIEWYRGPLLSGCQEEWIYPEREYRLQAYLEALDKLAQGAMDRGDPASATRWLRLTLATDAYRESAACSLMQALSESGDRAALQQVYQELRLRLHNDLNVTPAPETEALYQRLQKREALSTHRLSDFPASAPRSWRHLPVPLTDLVGREEEKEEVAGWLERSRLVTLLGSGGVGKTRLGIAVAEAVLPRFPDGVWFVDLSPLTEASLVPETTAKALGLSEQAGLSP
jgi:DNA-binding SARP family transcriptional activator